MKQFAFIIFFFFVVSPWSFCQPGKNGSYTVTTAGQVLNQYALPSTNIPPGANTMSIIPGPSFSLCAGDLIMIYETQGASMTTANIPAYGSYTPNLAGLYEFRYVSKVAGNSFTMQTNLVNSYPLIARAQIIKVPQYTNLVINAGASIAAKAWKDTTILATLRRFGGMVVVHASNIINNGTITASGSGFRGGAYANAAGTGIVDYVSTIVSNGGEKGESIFGYQAEYDVAGGRYCRGAPANGGGGGDAHNSGGGGGANGFNGNTWTGAGVMVVDVNNPLAAWALDPDYVANANSLTNSSGGGRGGYSWGSFNANALVDPPGSAVWNSPVTGADSRRSVGGLGGRPLTNINSESRIYFGGGGGAGNANNNASVGGASGGGIVYLVATGGISGTGVISSIGNTSGNTFSCSCDGASGGGAGGSIVIKTPAIPLTQTVLANGGKGGDQLFILPLSGTSYASTSDENDGPGGGGGGGYVAIATGAIVPNVNGGPNGQSLSPAVTEFPFNGATAGATGQTGTVTNNFISFITPTIAPIMVCSGSALSLLSPSAGVSYNWSGPNSFTSSVQNPTITGATTLVAGSYTVEVNLGNSCLALAITQVTVNTTPTISVPGATVCSPINPTLTASGATSYTWLPQNFVGNPYTATVSATHTVIGASNGCSHTVTTQVTINTTPTVSVPGATVCSPINPTLTASGATNYTWLPQNSFGSSYTSTASATYTIIGESNTCTNTTTAQVVIHPLPVITAPSPSVCYLSTAVITASGASTYTWFPQNFVGNPYTVSNATVTETYTVLGQSNGCTVSITNTLFIKPVPSLSFNTFTINCANLGSATVSASGGGSGPYSYTWMPTSQTTSIATGLFPGTYTIDVFDGGTGCTLTSTTNFAPLVPLTGTVSASNSLACNSVNTATANISLSGGSGSQTYSWTSSNGTQNTASATALPAGVTTVKVVDALTFCAFTTTFSITQPSALTLNIVSSSPSVCLGGSIQFTANAGGGTPGYTYTWTAGPATATLVTTETVASNYIYTVMSSDLNNCLVTQTVSVGFVVNPTVSVSDVSICPLQNGTLVASGATSYSWNTGASGVNFVSSPTVTTQYSVIGSALSCTASASASIILKPVPSVTVSTNAPICNGQALVLDGGSGASYYWTGPLGYTSALQSPTINPAVPGNTGSYNLKVTAANGCTNSASMGSTVNPTPMVSVLGSTVCQNQTLTLSAGLLAGATYTWTGPGGFLSTVRNNSISPALTSMTGSYSLNIESSAGCTNTYVVSASVVARPTITISGNPVMCQGATLSLSGSGGNTYAWQGPFGFSSATQSFSIVNVATSASGTYSLHVNLGPCSVDTSVLVTIHPLPVPVISGNTVVCETKDIQLLGSGGLSYLWLGPDSFSSTVATITISQSTFLNAGIYSLTVIDGNNCSAQTTSSVSVLNNPTVSVSGATVCIGEAASLSAGGGTGYVWVGPGGFSASTPSIDIPLVTSSQAGNYTVVVTGSNSCFVSMEVPLVGNPYPLPVAVAGVPAKVCMGTKINLQGSGGTTYLWQGPSAFTSTLQAPALIVNGNHVVGVYSLSVRNASNCAASTTVLLHVNPQPLANLLSSVPNACVPFCSGFRVKAAGTTSTSAPIVSATYLVDTHIYTDSVISYCFKKAGYYRVNVTYTDSNNCSNSSVTYINAMEKPEADFTYMPAKPLADKDEVRFFNTSQGDDLNGWNWFFSLSPEDTVKTKNATYLFKDAGIYPVVMIVRNKLGCSDTIIKTVSVDDELILFVPNSFTPNGDGINDVFQAKGVGVEKYNLQVFDRWGEKIFETNDFMAGWDGTYRGKNCSDDIYTWKIIVSARKKTQSLVGKVTLLSR